MGLQSAVLDEETAGGASGQSAEDLAAEVARLETLTAEKSALLQRLSDTERRGSEAGKDD